MTKTKPLQLFVRYAALSCNLHNKYIQRTTPSGPPDLNSSGMRELYKENQSGSGMGVS